MSSLPPAGTPIVGRVEIVLTADGQLTCQSQCPNLVIFLGMLEQAKAVSLAQQVQSQVSSEIKAVPPGLVNRLGGKNGS